jgi:hypothetical protein
MRYVDNINMPWQNRDKTLLLKPLRLCLSESQIPQVVENQTANAIENAIVPRGSLKVERRSMPYYYATASRRAANFDPWWIASKAHRSR